MCQRSGLIGLPSPLRATSSKAPYYHKLLQYITVKYQGLKVSEHCLPTQFYPIAQR